MTQVTELSSRVIVLIAYPTDAYKIMKIAYERGMFGKPTNQPTTNQPTNRPNSRDGCDHAHSRLDLCRDTGKGYLWIGTDWVNGLYFAGSPNAELMYSAMNGNLGTASALPTPTLRLHH